MEKRLTISVFAAWFKKGPLSAGDWSYWFNEQLADFSWRPRFRPGAYPGLDFYYQFTAKLLYTLGFSWPQIERVVWFWPFLAIASLAAYVLAKTFFPKKRLIYLLAPVVYLFNTYILMVVGGGQMGIALAYAFAPLVMAVFARLGKKPTFRQQILTGLIFGFQVIFDPRLALITGGAVGIYFMMVKRPRFKYLFAPVFVSLLINLYWFLPTIHKGYNLPAGYGGSGWVSFLSTANFARTISLLHPYWPENIFGKTYLMQPEFLGLPLLAFSALFFLKSLKRTYRLPIVYFSFLALGGAFLAKGSQPPFGSVYFWLFNHLPGMHFFRDAVKYYLLVALSYSILIPFSINQIYEKIKVSGRFWLSAAFFSLLVVYFLLLLKPAFLGQLRGTFRSKEVPTAYISLKDFIYQQPDSLTTLWAPYCQRFGYFSSKHPAISINEWLEDERCLGPFCDLKMAEYDRSYFDCHQNEKCFPADASFLANPGVLPVLVEMNIKYIIIPFDSEGEIFLYERAYDPGARQKLEQFLDKIPYLHKISVAPEIAVYEVVNN